MDKRSGALLGACVLAVAFAALPARAADDKSLRNMRGQVSWQQTGGAPQTLAPNARTILSDSDYALTAADSLAGIGLPDSSRVLVGSSSKVQLAFFNRAEDTTANFVIYNGKVRFIVEHPQGAKADYTFRTPTASISVRGTEGDIDSSGNDLRVNVYEVCDPNAPVTVTTKGGQQFTLVAGQSLVAQLVNGIVQATVQQLTQQMIDQFSPDFGVPANWDAAKGEIVAVTQNQAAGALDNVTGGYGNQIAGAALGLFHRKATPTPSPSPAAGSSCAH